MNSMIKPVLITASLLLATGCSQKLPLVSHAHIGHALTAWRDTPGEQGLFVVAEQETETARSETLAALASRRNTTQRLTHLRNVEIALNPDGVKQAGVKGYGAIRALNGATDHLVFASEADDASENMKKMTYEFSQAQVAVLERMRLAVEVARLGQQSSGQEQEDVLLQLQNVMNAIVEGEDANRNGRIDPGQKEYGLQQLRTMISTALSNESPAYHPVEKKYLFGLIRLPTGGWAYRFNTEGQEDDSYKHDSDMSYGYY